MASGVSLADSIAKGLVNPNGKLAAVLKGIEDGFAKNPPKSSFEALAIVQDAAQQQGLSPGYLAGLPTAGADLVLNNVGGVVTTLRANGEIIVEKRGSILLQLIP